jgi:hypothetical protein
MLLREAHSYKVQGKGDLVEMDSELKKHLLALLRRFPQSSAAKLSRALKEQEIEADKKRVNALLYEMATEGSVRRITNDEGKKPLWVAFESGLDTNPGLETLYLRAMKSPREQTHLAEVVAEVFEALDYHRAAAVRKMADSLKR